VFSQTRKDRGGQGGIRGESLKGKGDPYGKLADTATKNGVAQPLGNKIKTERKGKLPFSPNKNEKMGLRAWPL